MLQLYGFLHIKKFKNTAFSDEQAFFHSKTRTNIFYLKTKHNTN